MNKVILKGYIGSDVELKDLNGTKYARFSVATNKRYKDREGNTKEQAQFHNCVAWRQTGETIAKFFSKGSEILLEGEIQYRQWETDKGEKRYATDIVVENFEFCGKKDNAPAPSPAPQQQKFNPRAVQSTPIVSGDPEDGDLPF